MIQIRPDPDATPGRPAALLPVKVVPGARADKIAGPLGDRLKIRVSAPPEGGKANKAVCALLARAIGVKPARVTVHAGASNPEKIIRIEGLTPDRVLDRLT